MRPFSMIFWAIFLLVSGVVLLIRQFSPLNFNAFKVVLGVFVLLLGIALLTSPASSKKWSFSSDKNSSVFGQNTVYLNGSSAEHSTVFGESTVYLTDMLPGSTVEINTVFGECHVMLPAGQAIRVESSAAFGEVGTSDKTNNVNFGERNYTLEGEGEPIRLKVNVVFGQINLVR